jgi:hypothetical protein
MSTEYFINNSTIRILLGSPGKISKVGHILGHKEILSKYKKLEIIPCILSEHNEIKLQLNNKNNKRKYTNNEG